MKDADVQWAAIDFLKNNYQVKLTGVKLSRQFSVLATAM